MKIMSNPSFRYRERELKQYRHHLTQGDSLRVTGLRRIGKTWTMKQGLAIQQSTQPDWQAVYIDTQDFNHPFHLIEAILRTLPLNRSGQQQKWASKARQLPDKLARWVQGFICTGQVADVSVELREQADQVWQPMSELLTMLISSIEQPFTLVLDEVPFYLENLQQQGYDVEVLRLILASLKKWREAGLQMVVGGSISIDNQLKTFAIPTSLLGGLEELTVKPFNEAEMRSFIDELAQQYTLHWWQPGCTDQVLGTLLDYLPKLTKITMDCIALCEDKAELDSCLTTDVLPKINREFAYQFHERLSKNYNLAQQQQAERLLESIARDGAQTEPALQASISDTSVDGYDLLNRLLCDDFIALQADQRYDFSLHLQRRWWLQRLGLKPQTPVQELV